MASCPVASVLSEMATELKLLHLLYSPDILPCHVHSRYLVNLATSEERFVEEVQNIVQYGLRWRRVLLLHDDFLQPRGTYVFKIALSKASVKFKVLPLQNISTEADLSPIVPMLTNVYETFLFLHSSALDLFVDVAANKSLLQPQHQWFAVSDSTCREILGKSVLKDSNTILLKPTHFVHTSDYEKCPGHRLGRDKTFYTLKAHLLSVGIHILLKGSQAHNSWSCVQQPPRLNKNPEQFLNHLILANHGAENTRKNDLLTLTTNEGETSINLTTRLVSTVGFEYCSSDSKKCQGYTIKGSWNHLENLTTGSMFANVFTDFGNATIVIATNPAPPFVIKTVKDGQPPSYTGFCIDLLNEFAKRLKFSYELVEPQDGQFGSMNKDLTWSGVIGMVMNKEVTLGIGPISITSERRTVIDFTTAFAEDGTGILTRRPGFGSSKMFRLFKPFEPVVWVCLVCSVIITSAVLYLVNSTSPSAVRRFSCPLATKLTVFYCFWAILASSVNQGTDLQPMSHSARLVLGFWWVFIILVLSTYTASLAAVLTVNIYEKSISSLSELAEQTSITPLIKPGTNLQTLFQTATNDVYRSIDSRLVIYPEGATNEKAMVWVRERNMAFMTDRSQLEYEMQKECETYALAHEIFNSGGLGFVTQKGAPFLDALNLIIIKLRQSGIVEGWRSRWWANDGAQCITGTRVGEGQQLGLVYLAGPFFVFLSAIVVSVVIALGDWAWRAGKLRPIKARLRWWAATSREL
ncbi:hypothetical protein RRG08_038457 [Elysia crispata]|uniref:Glutamate receptor n=1 Tax=Elysia crispata TaxID=231223 RepID=A0AAE0ZX50_9GAST|nr:hypothetical protein RRG08_038457 [Elysia crispata]